MRKAIMLLCTMALAIVSRAQDSISVKSPEHTRSSYGAQIQISRESYRSAFHYLPGYPGCSPLFTDGGGSARGVMTSYSYRPLEKFVLSLSAGYANSSGTMAVDENSWLNIDGAAMPSVFHHAIDFTTNRLTASPSVGYELLDRLCVSLGGDVSYLLNTTFSSREEIAQPAGRAVFEDNGMRTRDVYSGVLPDLARIQMGVNSSVKYLLPMNRKQTLSLTPTLSYRAGITSLLKDLTWRENGATFAIGVEYRPEIPIVASPKQEKTVPLPRDTARARPTLFASLSAFGVRKDNTEEPAVRLKVEEVYETELVPLVPYVFFDSSEPTVPLRYHRLTAQETEPYSISKLPGGDALLVYDEVLNVIGKRMTGDSGTRLIITGCNDGIEQAGSPGISIARAKAVRDYLTNVWHISSDRLAIRARDLPLHFSPSTDRDGIAENRRVELSSSSAILLSPVLTSDTARFAEPPIIRFRTRVISEGGIATWSITAGQNGKVLKTFSGKDSVPSFLDLHFAKEENTIPTAPGVLEATLRVTDKSGQEVANGTEILFQQQTLQTKKREFAGNAEIEKYTLLLFDFNSSELSKDNIELARMIKDRIQKNSIVSVAGYGDRIGTPEYNRAVALSRARAVARALGISESSIEQTDGRTYLYNNDLPEGRFYSRTVQITIRNVVTQQN